MKVKELANEVGLEIKVVKDDTNLPTIPSWIVKVRTQGALGNVWFKEIGDVWQRENYWYNTHHNNSGFSTKELAIEHLVRYYVNTRG